VLTLLLYIKFVDKKGLSVLRILNSNKGSNSVSTPHPERSQRPFLSPSNVWLLLLLLCRVPLGRPTSASDKGEGRLAQEP